MSTHDYPSASELAALRAWYAGMTSRQAVHRYLDEQRAGGQSSRAMISRIRRRLAHLARAAHREDLARLLEHPAAQRISHAKPAVASLDVLRSLPTPQPLITDDVDLWSPARHAAALSRQGIHSLADLTLRIPRRRRWWAGIEGLGARGAAAIEAFFEANPELTEHARALIVVPTAELCTWEVLRAPRELDGSRGAFRAPRATCVLNADNDHQAISAWLSLHEVADTQRAYRKEAERLMLWALVERSKALSSLTTEDAIAYRAFLRRPVPRERWIGPTKPRTSVEWRPFQGKLMPRSIAYALSVINAMFRWLIEQRYVLANPFSGVKVRDAQRSMALDATRGFTDHEWDLIRGVAQGIEWTAQWSEAAAHRLRFMLDFWFATGLRPGELVRLTLADIHRDAQGDDWLIVQGKGGKRADVAMPLSAGAALDQYLSWRQRPTTRQRWDPITPLVPSLDEDGRGICRARLRAIFKRFFDQAAKVLESASPATSQKLRRATPHWLRHTHATHALAAGAELTTVRDNLRHASVATTSVYLHTDQLKRARQMREAFPTR